MKSEKTGRMVEKTTLQALNTRLEQYMQRVNEMRDAKLLAEREVDSVRRNLQEEAKVNREKLERDLEIAQGQVEKEVEEKTRLQLLEQQLDAELKTLRPRVEELEELQKQYDELQAAYRRQKNDKDATNDALVDTQHRLDAAWERVQEVEKANRSLHFELESKKSEIEQLRQQVQDPPSSRKSDLSSIRHEMEEKYEKLREQLKKEAEDRQRGLQQESQTLAQAQIDAYEDQVNDLRQELESTKQDLDQTSEEYQSAQRERQQATEKLAQVEQKLEEERSRFAAERRRQSEQNQKLREANLNLTRELNSRMTPMGLSAELKAYTQILSRQEESDGLPTPDTTPTHKNARKRKQNQVDVPTTKRLKRATANVKLVSMDLDSDMFVMENEGEEEVSLSGWQVRAMFNDRKFTFPSGHAMAPKALLTVASNVRNDVKRSELPEHPCCVAKKFSMDQKGEFLVLVTSDGTPVSWKSDGLPQSEVRSMLRQLKSEMQASSSEEDNNCGLM